MGRILRFESKDILKVQELTIKNRKSVLFAACKNRIGSLKAQAAALPGSNYSDAIISKVCIAQSLIIMEMLCYYGGKNVEIK